MHIGILFSFELQFRFHTVKNYFALYFSFQLSVSAVRNKTNIVNVSFIEIKNSCYE
jgi:hypothetical protein